MVDAGRVLMRFNALLLRLAGQRFDDAELRTVLTLLAGPGVVWELNFGSWVLLQPERINAYAQAVRVYDYVWSQSAAGELAL